MSEARLGSPTVVSGAREPLNLDDAAVTARRMPDVPALGTNETVYCSNTARYQCQITAPQTFIGPDGRKQTGGKMLVAKFDGGIFRNNDRDPATRALIDDAMQHNPYFGRFGGGSQVHFWLATEQDAKIKAAKKASAMKTLLSMPREELEAALGQLKAGEAEDHALPEVQGAAEGAGRTVKPIPAAQ